MHFGSAWAGEPGQVKTCGSKMRAYVLESSFRTIFFPLFGPGIFQLIDDWRLGLKATWRTGSLLESASAFVAKRQVERSLEQNLLEMSEQELPQEVLSYYQKFIKGKNDTKEMSVSQVVDLLFTFNQSAVEKGNCFLPCHRDGSLIKCTRKHLLRWMIPEADVSPEVEFIDGQEWVKIDLELSPTEVDSR